MTNPESSLLLLDSLIRCGEFCIMLPRRLLRLGQIIFSWTSRNGCGLAVGKKRLG
jgi:hypothetical protein